MSDKREYCTQLAQINERSTGKDCRPECGAWEKENSLWGREE